MMNKIKFMKPVLLSILFIFLCKIGISQVQLDNTEKVYLIGKQIYLYEDTSKRLTIQDVSKPDFDNRFELSKHTVPNFSFTTANVWCKIVVHNQTDYVDWQIHIGNPVLDTVTFYIPTDSTGYETTTMGYYFPFNHRIIKTVSFIRPFHLSKNETITCFVKIQCEKILNFPIQISTDKRFMKFSHDTALAIGIYLGLILIMIIYNLFVFFSVRDRSYLYYVLYILFIGLTNADLKGTAFAYLWPYSPWINPYLPILSGTSGVFALLFLHKFLDIGKTINFYVTLFWYVLMVLYSAVIFTALFGLTTLSVKIVLMCTLVASAYGMAVGIYLMWKKYKPAKYFLIAWIWVVIGAVVYILVDLDVIAYNFFTGNAVVIGSALEVIFLSFALADKINSMRKERQIAQKQVVETLIENERLIKEQNTVLEQKVKERTAEIEAQKQEMSKQRDDLLILNQKINQQNEEISSQSDFVKWYNDELIAKNEEITNIVADVTYKNKQITGSINYALTIQQAILPDLKRTKLYFENFTIYKPKDIVSGDFYWYSSLENKQYVAVIDCTGHGVPGAFMSLISFNLMNDIVKVFKISSPKEILERLDVELRKALKQNNNGNNDGMEMSLCCIEPEPNASYLITYVGAKSDATLYISATQSIEILKADRRSIGGFTNKKPALYNNKTFIVNKNDVIYLYSDGFIDQNAPNRKRLGSAKLQEIIKMAAAQDISEQETIFETEFRNYAQGEELRDDVTLLALKFK